MTLNQVRDFLDRVTYKPGYSLTASANSYAASIEIRMHCKATCAVTGAKGIDLVAVEHVFEYQPADMLPIIVYGMLRKAELHECAEWFKIDGKAPHYPH